MGDKFSNAFDYKVIYVFTVEDELHRGCVKIGDATVKTELTVDRLPANCRELNQAALARIKQYTNTLGANVKLLHTELAVKMVKDDDGKPQIKAFRDYDVHRVLKNSGIDNVTVADSTGREWYEIELQMAREAIDAVKANYKNLSNTNTTAVVPIVFRPEQKDAIDKVVKHFKKANRFLINAKMRYGKTFVALQIVKECAFARTLILTHRPVVDDGWYTDFKTIFQDRQDYIYGSKAKGYTIQELLDIGNSFIYFASLQDLGGSEKVGGKHVKNSEVFELDWDCVIVDEAHEGTKTDLGEDIVKNIVKENTKFLALSGTPFNIIDDYEEDEIYTWDYIMEQENKSEWDKEHFGDSNPYDELPELRIFTYDLGDILHNKNYVTYDDKAFNFREFFRTWTGEYKNDHANMPAGAEIGDFVHEKDVWSFLNLMTSNNKNSQYPFSTDEYRKIFKHSLWMVPGVKEAKALRNLMYKHDVFRSGLFDIVNVAGNGDEDEESEDALDKVRHAIRDAGDDGYTITLSCGKLTTGVTVKEWTAVFMLSGSYSTSAANYLQTIFRVQSPCNQNGKIKETAYVFDFAPDRTLKMVASAVSVSAKAGKTTLDDKQLMGKMLNYCPVIAVSGSKMEEYSANKLLQQLKRAYADKVVKNGFDDSNLYNDELFKLNDVDIQKFHELKGIIGSSKVAPKTNDIMVNNQGLTKEEYEETEKLKKKPKKELKEEEKKRLEELKKLKKLRGDAISILRGISIRMPLLIYGADVPYEDEITLEKFVDLVDDSSWEEFMPAGVTKERFKEFQKYYDEDVFVAAGRRIRNIAREADTLYPTERVIKIAGLFKYFKNPDKETVLTPWRVVNMHMSDCLGGWNFYAEGHKDVLDEPTFVDKGQVTQDVFLKPDTRILEINSKTGLYPLYVTYSVYRAKCMNINEYSLTFEKKLEIWLRTVQENVFVLCKTPMAKAITRRTLVGYNDERINAHYFDDLINTISNKPQLFVDKVTKGNYWKRGNTIMRFDAIVGNPPYMEMDGGSKASSSPVYQLFVDTAKTLMPDYLSMIIPSRWFSGGKGLDSFRVSTLHDNRIEKIVDYFDATECFPEADISGGVCYFLWNRKHRDDCWIESHRAGKISSLCRPLLEENVDSFIRFNEAIPIIRKIREKNENPYYEHISSRKPFGLSTTAKISGEKKSDDMIKAYAYPNNGFIERKQVTQNIEWIDKVKVCVSYAYGERGDFPYLVIGKPFIAMPKSCCTETYLVVGIFDDIITAKNMISYMTTKFFRFLVLMKKNTQHATKMVYSFVPDQDYSKQWTDELLYKKYNLSDEEIKFVESMVKPLQV
ncbi:MAG: DEAD/DEAH box helicase family protein [Eubacterium sp.]|nr:DEAD/DEAH box helicase family protein [Eubacterium sp.]